MDPNRSQYRSLFWPIVLIGVGFIWLLGNLGWLANVSPGLIFRFWPVALIMIGLDLLIGRRSTILSVVMGLLTVAIIVGVLFFAPRLGLPALGQVQEDHFSEQVGEATSAQVILDVSSEPVTLFALDDSTALIDVQARHFGRLDFRVAGTQDKRISLNRTGNGTDWFSQMGEQVYWKVGLSGAVPIELNLEGGSGSLDADLTGLDLTGLSLDSGSGSSTVTFPSSENGYNVDYSGGSGSATLRLPDNTSLTLRLDTGSGSVSIDIPVGAAARVEVRDSGSGSVSISGDLDNIERGDDDEGIWETEGYAQAADQIEIILEDVGSGSINIR